MCLKRLTITSAFVASFVCSGSAMGQTFTLVPSLTLEERYDSNATFRKRDSGFRSDFITTASPSLHMEGRTPRLDFMGEYSLFADYHSRDQDLNSTSHRLGADLKGKLTERTDFSAGDSLHYTKDSLKASNVGIQVVRTDIFSNSAYLSARRQMDGRTGLGFTLRDTVVRYDDPSLFDTRTDSAGVFGTYLYRRTGTAKLEYRFTNYNYEGGGLAGGKDMESHLLSAGVTEEIEPKTSITAGAGVAYIHDIGNNYYMTGSLGINRSMEDSRVGIEYAREVTNPSGLTNTINIHDRVTFNYTQDVYRNVAFSLFGGMAKNRTEPDKRVDINSYMVEVRGDWQVRRWAALGLGLSHFQQWTNDSLGEGLSRDRIFINVKLTGPEWRF